MTRYTQSYFEVPIQRKYCIPWLSKKGWKETSGGASALFIDPVKGNAVTLENAVVTQMIRDGA